MCDIESLRTDRCPLLTRRLPLSGFGFQFAHCHSFQFLNAFVHLCCIFVGIIFLILCVRVWLPVFDFFVGSAPDMIWYDLTMTWPLFSNAPIWADDVSANKHVLMHMLALTCDNDHCACWLTFCCFTLLSFDSFPRFRLKILTLLVLPHYPMRTQTVYLSLRADLSVRGTTGRVCVCSKERKKKKTWRRAECRILTNSLYTCF